MNTAAPYALAAAAAFALLSYHFPAVCRALVAASLILFWMALLFVGLPMLGDY